MLHKLVKVHIHATVLYNFRPWVSSMTEPVKTTHHQLAKHVLLLTELLFLYFSFIVIELMMFWVAIRALLAVLTALAASSSENTTDPCRGRLTITPEVCLPLLTRSQHTKHLLTKSCNIETGGRSIHRSVRQWVLYNNSSDGLSTGFLLMSLISTPPAPGVIFFSKNLKIMFTPSGGQKTKQTRL